MNKFINTINKFLCYTVIASSFIFQKTFGADPQDLEIAAIQNMLTDAVEKLNKITDAKTTTVSRPIAIADHSVIIDYVDKFKTCYKAAIDQCLILFSDPSSLIQILYNLEITIAVYTIIVLLGLIFSLFIGRFIDTLSKRNYLLRLFGLVIQGLPEILCGGLYSILFSSYGTFNKSNQICQFLLKTNDIEVYIELFSYIALILFLSKFFFKLTQNSLNSHHLLRSSKPLIGAMFFIRILKKILITFMLVTSYQHMDSFKQDIDNIEILFCLMLLLIIILRLRNIINYRNIQFGSILKYISIPIIATGIFAYTSKNNEARLMCKILLTISVWPILYKLYSIFRSFSYSYIRTLPRYGIRHAIHIFLIISNSLRYIIFPLSVILMTYIFDINLLSEVKSFLGQVIYYRLIMIIIILFIGRLSFIANIYLCTLYEQLNSSRRPFDKQRIVTSANIIRNVSSVLLCLIIILTLLSVVGIDISPLFQTLGLFSAALTLSLQDLIRSMTNGLFILYDNSIKTGDLVEYDNKTAVVEIMHVRYMRIRFDDGLLVTVPFHKLDIIKNKSRQQSYIILNISFDRKANIDIAEQAIEEGFKNIRERPEFKYKILKDMELRDLADVTAFSYVMQCRICVQPNSQYKIRRALNRELKIMFEKYDIAIAVPLVANATNVPSINTGESYPDFQ